MSGQLSHRELIQSSGGQGQVDKQAWPSPQGQRLERHEKEGTLLGHTANQQQSLADVSCLCPRHFHSPPQPPLPANICWKVLEGGCDMHPRRECEASGNQWRRSAFTGMVPIRVNWKRYNQLQGVYFNIAAEAKSGPT